MKIWVIWSSSWDTYLLPFIQSLGHECVVFLDQQYGPWWQMSIKDSLKRLIALVEDNQSSLDECKRVVLPPVYELLCRDLEYALSAFDLGDIPWIDSLKVLTHKVAPVYYAYITTSVLPYSKVGKIGCVGYRNHNELLQSLRGRIVTWYELSPTQLSKKYFQVRFPLYTVSTDHRSILYDLPRSWFVNKLIKHDLKKLKDYAIDTLLPLERGYFKHQRVFTQTFHSRVRVHKVCLDISIFPL